MKILRQATRKKFIGLAFISPWIIGFIIFTLIPFFETIVFSFSKVRFKTDGITTEFIGFDNFADVLFVDPKFKLAIPEYLKQVCLFVPMVLVFSIIIAVLLNSKIKGKRFFRAIYFLPVILMSGPVVDNLIKTNATQLSGVQSFFVYEFIQKAFPEFLSMPVLYIFDNVILFLWFSGVQILILLSGLQKTDPSIYEAAKVDGASAWQQFWKITMTTLKPFIFLNAIYTIIDVSNSTINPIVPLIKLLMFDAKGGFGNAAAATWIYFFMSVLVVLAAYILLGRGEKPIKEKSPERRHKK